MSSQGPCFLLAISWILRLKKNCLDDLTLLLNSFQLSRLLVDLWLLNARLHSLFHQLLKCLVILTCFEFILYVFSRLDARELVVSSSLLLSDRSETLMFLITYETSLIKFSSSLLFFTIENFDVIMFSSAIGMDTVIGA